jgi:hypothetical protein
MTVQSFCQRLTHGARKSQYSPSRMVTFADSA